MKSLFYTLLILGGAFLGYDYFLAPAGQKIVFKSLNPPLKARVVQVTQEKAEKPTVDKSIVASKPAMPVVEKPKPVVVASPTISSGPKFDPIEVLTGNWLKIPVSAFPREVKLLQEATYKMSVGSSKVAAGGMAFALGAENGVLTLAPTVTSPARAQVPIDGTDLKTQLIVAYDKWKIVRAVELKTIAAKKLQSPSVTAAPVAPSSSEVDAGGKPVRAGDGSFPLLLASMKSGQVTEIKPELITGWQEAQPTSVQGKSGWAVKVSFNAKTIFGLQPVDAQALVLDGRVKGWYYTGSGEEVP